MEDKKVVSMIEDMLISAQKMSIFAKSCDSESTINKIFEANKELEKGHITVMIEMKDVPCSEIFNAVSEIADLTLGLEYNEIPKEAYRLTAQESI